MKKSAALLSALMALMFAVVAVVTPTASAAPAFNENPTGTRGHMRPGCIDAKLMYWVQSCWVESKAMGKKIKVQIQPAMRGGTAGLYLLDGMRATDFRNAWMVDPDAHKTFVRDNVTLVMPVGGRSSFYTDWSVRPSTTFNGENVNYAWDTFLSKELPVYLQQNFGVDPNNNGIAGLSMGGSASLAMAAKHPKQFKLASSFSGYLHTTVPGMWSMIGLAQLEVGGYKITDMWGNPNSEKARADDPWFQAERLRGKDIYISSATGIPGNHDQPKDLQQQFNTFNGTVLEGLSRASARDFQLRLATLGIPAQFSLPDQGIHSWYYWTEELHKARPFFLKSLNAR